MSRLSAEAFKVEKKSPLVVVLDNVRSLHNVGSWSICPTSVRFKPKWGTAEEHLRTGIRVAKALGSPVFRVVLGGAEDRKTPGGIQARIDDCLIAQLQTSESSFKERPARLFEVGDQVRFTDGPFTGIEGVFQIAEGEKRVMVLIEMMSKPLSVGVAPSLLRKIG